jgi:hypothetical protein
MGASTLNTINGVLQLQANPVEMEGVKISIFT